MTGLPRREINAPSTDMRNLKWSAAEKAIARKGFDLALRRELEVVIREAKDRAAGIEQPSDLWELESYLTHRRKEIDRKYDYRYSILPLVFGSASSPYSELHSLPHSNKGTQRQLDLNTRLRLLRPLLELFE